MLAPQLITPPPEIEKSAVPIDDLKRHLRVETRDEDTLIDSLGIAATKALDAWQGTLGGHCLVEQTWSESFDRFPCGESWPCRDLRTMQNVLRLRLFPVIEIVSVKYYDSAAVLQTVSPSAYRILSDALGAFVASIPGAASPWPSSTQCRADAVIVEYKAGYGEAADVPEPIRQAIRMHVAHMYENREATGVPNLTEVPLGYAELIAPYRRSFFA